MLKTEFLRTRLAPQHSAKIELMRQQTGLTTSQVIRQLVERAEVEPLQMSTHLSGNTNNDDRKVSEASSVTRNII